MKKFIYLFTILGVLFSGCSLREYYKPNKSELSHEVSAEKSIDSEIKYFTRDVATLKDNKVIPINKKLPKGFVAIDTDLAKKGSVLLVNNKQIKFDKLIATASKSGNLVAIIFGDNHFELYDLDKNKTIATQNFGDYLALRKFVAKPYFYKDLLLIPTLNGKMVVFDTKAKKIIRSLVISQKDYFSNVIYLGVKKDSLIVASRDNILVITPEMVFSKNYNIKHILVSDFNIYVFTIEGDVIKLNLVLKELAKKSFKFANIIAPTFVGKYIYFAENGDGTYLIRLNRNLKHVKVYPLDTEDLSEVNTFVKGDVLYMGDKYINLKDIK
jgi:hypothetical protein